MLSDLKRALRPAIAFTLLLALLLGIAYPLLLTAIGQAFFPAQANGSLVRDGDRVIGSALIGQAFAADRYFHGRPSAAGKGYDATASSGSNLAPTAQALATRVAGDVKALSASAPGRPVPPDLATTSASGLDPDISPAAADFQAARIARARGMTVAAVRAVIARTARGAIAGFLGEPRLNVLALNRALDAGGHRP